MTEAFLLLVSLVLILACGAFVAAEFALITVDRPRIEAAAAAGDRRANGVLSALRSLSTQLSGAQVGITLTNLAIGFLAERAIAELIEGPLHAAGLPSGSVSGIAVTVAMIAATAATMIYGELVPKNLAIAEPLRVAKAVQGFLRVFTRCVAWPIRALNFGANALLRVVGVEPQEELASARSPEELLSLLERSAAQGTLPGQTAALLQRSLEFGDKRADDVMTARVNMHTVGADDPVAAVIALTIGTGFSRFPVIGQDSDDVLGLVHIRDAVAVPDDERAGRRVRDVMTAAVLVPGSLHLDPLLEQMRRDDVELVVVLDEYGGVDGILTLEDMVEELVGDVADEHDRHSVPVRSIPGGWALSGQLRPDEVSEATSVEIPTGREYETIAGLLAKELGRIPKTGDVVGIGALQLRVAHMVGRRVDRVILEPADDTTDDAADEVNVDE